VKLDLDWDITIGPERQGYKAVIGVGHDDIKFDKLVPEAGGGLKAKGYNSHLYRVPIIPPTVQEMVVRLINKGGGNHSQGEGGL